MAKLKLKLQKFLEGDQLEAQGGVIANVYNVSPGSKSPASRGRRGLVVPVDSGANQSLDVDVDSGQYLVEAVLPSGDTVSQVVDVATDDVPVTLQLEDSPHEWLSWQHFMGRVEQSADAYHVRTSARPGSGQVDASVLAAAVAGGGGFDPVARVAGEIGDHDGLVTASSVADAIGAASHAPVDRAPAASQEHDAIHARYLFGHDHDPHAGGGGHYRDPHFRRRYFLVEHAGGVTLSALPTPWCQANHDAGHALVEALVEPSATAPPAVSINVRDKLVGSVLGYLGFGQLPSAAALVRPARHMLLAKVNNPMAAAAGAYALYQSRDPGDSIEYDSSDWHHWVRNLRDWFPWQPDGAVLLGWLQLRGQRGADDVANARDDFVRAATAGIPVFSLGVQMLVDGLTMFAHDDDTPDADRARVGAALAHVRRYAVRVDMKAPFTTLKFHRPRGSQR